MFVRHGSLVFNKAFVNGSFIDADSRKQFNVVNPATGEVITPVPDMDVSDVEKTITLAHDAFKEWKNTTAKERGIVLRKWYNLLVEHQEELARIITSEAGKPYKESLGEVAYGNSFIDWFAEESRRINGEVIPSPVKSKRIVLIKQPIGVVGLITPWNFPHAMITRKAGAALAAGCTCVVKPAEDTPLTALALAALADQAGLPKGVLNVITCDRSNAPAVGKLLCESPLTAGISFTGSTAVGKILYQQCASGVKKVAFELGGNAPFIVFNSATIEKAVEGAIACKFRNSGQTCVSANRIFVQDKVFSQFVGALKEAMDKCLKIGKTEDCNVGPLINEAQMNKVSSLVDDAVSKGAKVLLGGKKAQSHGSLFYEPTLLTDVTPDMLCAKEEIFGPIAVCYKFKTEDEVIAAANDVRVGLAGYFYSNDIGQIWRVAEQLEVGMVGVNEGIISTAEAAFGGVKESGIGREGSHHGIDEFTDVKYICFGNLD